MRVLIIEDDDQKQLQLVETVKTFMPEAEVQTARSLQTGIRAVKDKDLNLVLLDMTMRNFDRTSVEEGGRPHAFAGLEILRQMRRNRVSTPVIVVTHFDRFGEEKNYTTLEQLKSDLRDTFTNYLGTVQYKSNVDDWQDQLFVLISKIERNQG